jgi:ABC-type lipoprotein export system ATPase subunit/ABC-type antimicrobial peptide transport system permease subunit
MISVNKLNKYFNKGKTNEIHVINDINLTLPDKGLVVLLGPSGSGKTTLLNVIGGLDKVQGGSIHFDNQVIEKYNSKTWDNIRNRKVGYVFQNYNLLTNLTVYDNISLTLNMIGIYDKEEIDKRIDYILDSMGMINYRKRRASQLSGGQQQRVAIARALAKNPQVIIADEPTGNLDSKNTEDIMNILKKISENKLVVLVTHEEHIASIYGDRIIRLRDGQIVSDDENKGSGRMDVKHETDIYLGDLRAVDSFVTNDSTFSVYSDENIDDKMDIRLIIKNKTVYVDVKSKEYKKMQLLERDSEINIIDGKFESLEESPTQTGDFDLDSIVSRHHQTGEKTSVISAGDSVRLAWNRIKNTKLIGKLFYLGFVGVAGLIALAVGLLSGIYTMTPDEFLDGSADLVEFNRDVRQYDDLITLAEGDANTNYLQIVGSGQIESSLPTLFQMYDDSKSIYGDFVYSEYMNVDKVIAGTTSTKINEVVLDSEIADSIIKNSDFNYAGITTYQDIFNIDYHITLHSDKGEAYEYPVKIVGIVESDSKVIYAHKDLILMAGTGMGIYEVFADDITKTDGVALANDNEMWMLETDTLLTPLGDNVYNFQKTDVKAVATYTSTKEVPYILMSRESIERLYFDNTYTQKNADIFFHTSNVEDTLTYLKDKEIEAVSVYEQQLTVYRQDRLNGSVGIIIFAAVVIGASAVSYFFILRSSLLSRIYEVSVYRSLGVTKGDIRKMFTIETIFITTLTSLIGYLVVTGLLYRIQIMGEDFFDIITITPLSIVAGIVIIYVTNIVFGLIPVSNLLRKTPAEIMSRYDF